MGLREEYAHTAEERQNERPPRMQTTHGEKRAVNEKSPFLCTFENNLDETYQIVQVVCCTSLFGCKTKNGSLRDTTVELLEIAVYMENTSV